MHSRSFVVFLAVTASSLPTPQPIDRRAGGLLDKLSQSVNGLLGNLLGGDLLGSLLGSDKSGSNLLGDDLLGSLLGGDLLGDLLGGSLLGGQDSEKETPDPAPSDLVCGSTSCISNCTKECQGGVQKCASCLASCLQPATQNKTSEKSYLDAEGEQELDDFDPTVYSPYRAIQVSKGQPTQEATASQTAEVSPDTKDDANTDASQ